ncbi:MAG TPA: hypothetical protein VEQ40_12310 [Pyrinomonadaceae bacterium]|nr:hypothetical protein [Pyrinomonadaceae bacterium]
MIICPCCGLKFEGDLREGCKGCGARAVGPPLARPERELPAYGRAVLVTASGALLLATFASATLFALYEQDTFSLAFWSVVSAAETAAWRLKLMLLPAALLSVWMGALLCRTIRREPQRFMGSHAAHAGLASSALVVLMMLTFIGVTVPERLRQRQRGIEAGIYAEGYTIQRALLEYRARYGTYPTDMKDLRERLPDPDGRLAAALNAVDSRGYTPRADLASTLPTKSKTRRARPAQIRRAALDSTTDDGTADEKVSFTNYELRLPGEDKLLNTEDDWLMRDGVILKPSAFKQDTEQGARPSVRKVD